MWTLDQVVNERYRILAETAQGESGRVCRALDERSGRTCALEFVAFDPSKNGGWRGAAEEELERLRALENPLIVTPDAIEEAPDGLLIVQESFDGLTLDEVIRAQAPLTLPRACFIARCVAMALEAAHHAGVIHGDLKPSNIFLVRQNNKETVKVLGFGTFGLKKASFINMARLTLGGGHPISGTPEYVSPEQALGTLTEALDGRSDIYSLGIILYQALSGSVPFKGQSAMEILLAHVFSTPRSLIQFPELAIPEVLDSLLLRCLAKRREDRPSSATALVDQLGPWEERVPTFAPAEPAEDEPAPQAHDSPVIASPLIASQRQSFPIASEPEAPPLMSQAPRAKEPQAVDPEFVVDLHVPDQPGPAALDSLAAVPPSQPFPAPAPIDVVLDRVPGPLPAAVPQASPQQPASGQAPVFLGSYMPREAVEAPRRSGVKWIWAAAVVLFLMAGACGWLFFTGRTYWFRPEYLQRRISLIHLSLSAGGSNTDSPSVNQTPGDGASAPPAAERPSTNPAAPAAAVPPSSSTSTPSAAAAVPPAVATGGPQAAAAPSAVPSTANTVPPATSRPSSAPPVGSARPVRPSRSSVPATPNQRSVSRTRTSKVSSVAEAMRQGESYFERGQYDEAIHAYQTGLVQDPSNVRLRADIAQAKKAKAAEAKFLGQ